MKFKMQKDELIMTPECDMDLYNIGVLHTQYGGKICYDNEVHKITEYSISAITVIDFLILHSSDNGK